MKPNKIRRTILAVASLVGSVATTTAVTTPADAALTYTSSQYASRLVQLSREIPLGHNGDTVGTFLAVRNRQPKTMMDPAFNWSSDGCSAPWGASAVLPGDPSRTFRDACYRHDFAYRNWVKSNRWGVAGSYDTRRKRADDQFKADMLTICMNKNAGDSCYGNATIYYNAVRVGG